MHIGVEKFSIMSRVGKIVLIIMRVMMNSIVMRHSVMMKSRIMVLVIMMESRMMMQVIMISNSGANHREHLLRS